MNESGEERVDVAARTAKSFGMTFSWGETAPCDDPKSPPLEIFNAPSGAAYLQITLFKLKDGENRGSAMAAIAGKSSFSYGAFTPIGSHGYKGPCEAGIYRLEVTALDGGGEEHAIATGTLAFP